MNKYIKIFPIFLFSSCPISYIILISCEYIKTRKYEHNCKTIDYFDKNKFV